MGPAYLRFVQIGTIVSVVPLVCSDVIALEVSHLIFVISTHAYDKRDDLAY